MGHWCALDRRCVDLLAAMPADTWAVVTSGRRPMALARLASAGLAPNARDREGSSGCGTYSSAKVARPAANSPSRTRRIPGSAYLSFSGCSSARVTRSTLDRPALIRPIHDLP